MLGAAPAVPTFFDQVKAEPNPERRARAGVDSRPSLIAGRKTPGRDTNLYKYAEVYSGELLIRRYDLERRRR